MDGRKKEKTKLWLEKMKSNEFRQKQRENAIKNGNRPPIALGNKVNLGRKPSIETRIKMRESQLKRIKEGRHNNYKGLKNENKRIRGSLEYKLWREAIFKRDDWTCKTCFVRGKKLHAHHILSFAKFPEVRLSINNGITLCENCHKKTDSYLKRI